MVLLPGCRGIVAERLEGPKIVGDGTGIGFVFEDLSAISVAVAGEFNDWTHRRGDRKSIFMTRREDGLWQVVIPYREHVRLPQYDHLDDEVYLERGRRYEYKLVVNESDWRLDPANRSTFRRPGGDENSLLVVP